MTYKTIGLSLCIRYIAMFVTSFLYKKLGFIIITYPFTIVIVLIAFLILTLIGIYITWNKYYTDKKIFWYAFAQKLVLNSIFMVSLIFFKFIGLYFHDYLIVSVVSNEICVHIM